MSISSYYIGKYNRIILDTVSYGQKEKFAFILIDIAPILYIEIQHKQESARMDNAWMDVSSQDTSFPRCVPNALHLILKTSAHLYRSTVTCSATPSDSC